MFPFTFDMMRRSPDLESIIVDSKFGDDLVDPWFLNNLICDTSKPGDPVFVWSNLKHAVLWYCKCEFWEDKKQVGNLVKFLVAHPNIETLVSHETSLWSSQNAVPLSLSSYPNSLPRLKIPSRSLRLLAGVLESRAASSSVFSFIDISHEMFDPHGAKASHVERILAALERVPDNPLGRVLLEVTQLSRKVYMRFAQAAPGVRCLEFLMPTDGSGISTTPRDDSFDPLVSVSLVG